MTCKCPRNESIARDASHKPAPRRGRESAAHSSLFGRNRSGPSARPLQKLPKGRVASCCCRDAALASCDWCDATADVEQGSRKDRDRCSAHSAKQSVVSNHSSIPRSRLTSTMKRRGNSSHREFHRISSTEACRLLGSLLSLAASKRFASTDEPERQKQRTCRRCSR